MPILESNWNNIKLVHYKPQPFFYKIRFYSKKKTAHLDQLSHWETGFHLKNSGKKVTARSMGIEITIITVKLKE